MVERSVKNCTKSGQWAVKDGLEWTDYTPCLNKQVSLRHYQLIILLLYACFLTLHYITESHLV